MPALHTYGGPLTSPAQIVGSANQTQWYPRLTSISMDTDYEFNETNTLTERSSEC